MSIDSYTPLTKQELKTMNGGHEVGSDLKVARHHDNITLSKGALIKSLLTPKTKKSHLSFSAQDYVKKVPALIGEMYTAGLSGSGKVGAALFKGAYKGVIGFGVAVGGLITSLATGALALATGIVGVALLMTPAGNLVSGGLSLYNMSQTKKLQAQLDELTKQQAPETDVEVVQGNGLENLSLTEEELPPLVPQQNSTAQPVEADEDDNFGGLEFLSL